MPYHVADLKKEIESKENEINSNNDEITNLYSWWNMWSDEKKEETKIKLKNKNIILEDEKRELEERMENFSNVVNIENNMSLIINLVEKKEEKRRIKDTEDKINKEKEDNYNNSFDNNYGWDRN